MRNFGVVMALLVALIALSLTWGCVKKQDKKSFVGKWKAEYRMTEKEKTEPDASYYQGMGEMTAASMSLEILQNNRFKFLSGAIPIEGTTKQEGNQLILTPDKFAGMTAEEFKKFQKDSKSPAGFVDPSASITLDIAADGQELAIVEDGSEAKGGFVFVRDTSKPRKVESKVAAGIETSLVGVFVPEFRVDESKLTAEERKYLPIARGMVESNTLQLFADKTFQMSIMEGDWTVSGDMLTLDITKVPGMQAKDIKTEPMRFTILDSGKTLHSIKDASDKGHNSKAMNEALYYVKK